MKIKQIDIAIHLGLSKERVSSWLKIKGIKPPYDLDAIRVAYIKNLSENAAGRAGTLAEERALLAKEQRIKIARENAIAEGKLHDGDEVTQFMCKETFRAKTRLLRLPREIALAVPKECAIEAEQAAKQAIYQALENLSSDVDDFLEKK